MTTITCISSLKFDDVWDNAAAALFWQEYPWLTGLEVSRKTLDKYRGRIASVKVSDTRTIITLKDIPDANICGT